MSFLTGHSKTTPNVNRQTANLEKGLASYLTGRGFEGLFPGTELNMASIQPYLDLFTAQNKRTMAQAKESAGNLTGSGFANILGARAGEASTEQGAFLTNLLEQRRQADRGFLLQALLGTLGSPSAGQTTTYQPGLLDYAAQGAAAAVPFLGRGNKK